MRTLKRPIVWVLLGSLVLKLWYWQQMPTVSRDGCFYLLLAQRWHDAGFAGLLQLYPEMWLPPLFLYLITLLMHCGCSAETAGLALNLATGTLIPFWIYGIAREVTRRRDAAFAALLLAAVHPMLNFLSVQVQRDALYLSLTGAVLWLVTAGIRRGGCRQWLWAGVLSGAAVLTRFEAAELPVIVSGALVYLAAVRHFPWKHSALCFLLFLAGFLGSIAVLAGLMQIPGYLYDSYGRYCRGRLELLLPGRF